MLKHDPEAFTAAVDFVLAQNPSYEGNRASAEDTLRRLLSYGDQEGPDLWVTTGGFLVVFVRDEGRAQIYVDPNTGKWSEQIQRERKSAWEHLKADETE